MEGYFYHGIETYYGTYGHSIELMLKILKEGIKTRKEVHNHFDDELNHVCLYKKENDFDYNDERYRFKSARSSWIDNCFVFIISNEVEAVKATNEETDILDEYRSVGSIPPSRIKGIALPMEAIKEYLEEETKDDEIINDQEKLRNLLPIITDYALNNNLIIVDSCLPNFTDELDNSLINQENKKSTS